MGSVINSSNSHFYMGVGRVYFGLVSSLSALQSSTESNFAELRKLSLVWFTHNLKPVLGS